MMQWRLGSELNRRTRICSPLHDHSATQPKASKIAAETKSPAVRGFSEYVGAGNEIRTRDLYLGKVSLYQLSYSRNEGKL